MCVGVLLILCTRDGNNKIVPLAWVTCLTESGPNYQYFAERCKEVEGLQPYLDRATQLLYSDRHKGIPAFEALFGAGAADCIEHNIKSCRRYVSSRGGKVGFHREQIYRLQREHTREGYLKALASLRKGFPEVADYFDGLDHDKTYLYAMLKKGYTTHRHSTSNIAEATNSFLGYVWGSHK